MQGEREYLHLRAFWTRRSFMAVRYAENLMLFKSAAKQRETQLCNFFSSGAGKGIFADYSFAGEMPSELTQDPSKRVQSTKDRDKTLCQGQNMS